MFDTLTRHTVIIIQLGIITYALLSRRTVYTTARRTAIFIISSIAAAGAGFYMLTLGFTGASWLPALSRAVELVRAIGLGSLVTLIVVAERMDHKARWEDVS